MQKPKKTSEWAAVAIIGLLAAIIAARGVAAIATQHYSGTARFSGPYDLYGLEAIYQGAAWVCLGLMIACTMGLQFQLPRRRCLATAGVMLLGSAGFFILSFSARH